MIKGIIALFTSGIIFNPMVLLGIIFGFLFDIFLSYEEILSKVYKNPHFYLLGAIFAGLYVYFIKPTYTEGGRSYDWAAMGLSLVFSTIKFVIASVLAIAFAEMFAF